MRWLNKKTFLGIGLESDRANWVKLSRNKNTSHFEQWQTPFAADDIRFTNKKNQWETDVYLSLSPVFLDFVILEISQRFSRSEIKKIIQQKTLKTPFFQYAPLEKNGNAIIFLTISIKECWLKSLVQALLSAKLKPRSIEIDLFTLTRLIPNKVPNFIFIYALSSFFIITTFRQKKLCAYEQLEHEQTLISTLLNYKNRAQAFSTMVVHGATLNSAIEDNMRRLDFNLIYLKSDIDYISHTHLSAYSALIRKLKCDQ